MADHPLLEWLTATLDDVEREARAATAGGNGVWRYNPRRQWEGPKTFGMPQREAEEFVAAGPLDAAQCVAATGPANDPQSMADARFIAAWDPAAVLASVEADRAILALHPRTAYYSHTLGLTYRPVAHCPYDRPYD